MDNGNSFSPKVRKSESPPTLFKYSIITSESPGIAYLILNDFPLTKWKDNAFKLLNFSKLLTESVQKE